MYMLRKDKAYKFLLLIKNVCSKYPKENIFALWKKTNLEENS